jgi:hypothetical protein
VPFGVRRVRAGRLRSVATFGVRASPREWARAWIDFVSATTVFLAMLAIARTDGDGRIAITGSHSR